MRKRTFFLAFALFPLISRATNITLQGNFAADDSIQLFSVSIAAPATIDVRSYAYAGGTTSTGTVVPRGGFDTILTLFSASGVFLNENDDGAGVATDPSTGMAADARITANLAAGSYILALTQYDNFSIGDLADGFAETGHPNFTADPGFANGDACPGNIFRDISGTDGRCRNGNWALDFINVASVTPTAVPEPSALLLASLGLALLLAGRCRRWRKPTLLAGGLVAALASVPVQAQTDPDFTNVNDILHGNRTLLQVTDVEIVENGPETASNVAFYQLPMSNSSPGQTQPPLQVALLSPESNLFRPLELSGRIFNLPKAVTVQIAPSNMNFNFQVQYAVQNANIDPNFNLFNISGPQSPINGVVSDFNGDGCDDIALEFDDGSYRIMTATDVNQVYVPFAQDPLKAGPAANLDVLTTFTAGDFDGKGHREIAGLTLFGDNGGTPFNHLGLVVYAVDPGTLQIQRAYSKPFVLTTPGASADNPITHVSIARGRFNTASHDQVAVTFGMLSGPSIVEIVDFDSALNPVEGPQLTVSNTPVPEGIYTGYIQVTIGKFALPNNPYDQIVFHVSSTTSAGDKFFEVLSANPTDLTLTAHSGITYNQFPCAAYNGIQVGNFDHQQADGHNPNSQIALLFCTGDTTTSSFSVYSVDPQTFNVQSTPDSSLGLNIYAQNAAFVATDIQGRFMVLGEPTKVTINSSKPTIINAAPPMHIDYITPVGGNKPEVLNLSFIPDGFNSSFALTQESTTGSSTTHKMSWSAGVDLSVSGSYQVGDPDDGVGTKYSAAFHLADDITGSSDNSTITYATTNFDVSASTTTGDAVFYDDSRLNIWVYPVLGQKVCPAALKNPNCPPEQQVPLTVQFSGPDQIETGPVSASDLSTNWYQPPWEFGNVFSYPATKDQLALIYPDLAQTQLSTDLTFDTDNLNQKIETTWTSSTEQGSTASLSDTASFDVTTSFVSSVGLPAVANTKFSGSLKLSGSVGFAKLQTNTAQVNASNGIAIQAVATFPDPGNYKYSVTPFILGNSPPSGVGDSQQPPLANIQKFGPLKTAFTVDPIDKGAWWKQAYTSGPDVALNHPSRWILTKPALGSTLPSNCGNYGKGSSDVDCADIAPFYDDNHQPLNPWNSNFFSMHGFFITSADNPGAGPQLGFARAGDKLDLAVRVYNYSLYPLMNMPNGTQVHVRFYAMPWDNANDTPAGDSFLIGESTADPIPPFDDSKTDLNWRVIHAPAPFDTTPYAGKYFAFWVVVWMEDSNGGLVSEIQGHGLTSIPSTLTKPSDVPLEMALNTQSQAASYSNNVGFYHYAFPVLPPETDLGAPAPNNPADITLKNVSAAKKRIQAGELDEITAVLRAGSEGARRLKVYFYDGDPDADGKLIGTEAAWFEPRTITKVRIPYHPPSDGVHQIWAVINRGKPYQTERHTSAIVVGLATADRNNSDGDEPPNGKADNDGDKN